MNASQAKATKPPRKKKKFDVSADAFKQLGADMMNWSVEGSELMLDARFHLLFGVSAVVCALGWTLLCQEDILPDDCKATYLLWALMFLKTYDTEKNLSGIARGVDEKTFRKWIWIILDGIAFLEYKVIRWENWKCIDIGNDCTTSVDAVDFMMEGFPSLRFAKQNAWYTKKHNGPGIHYEVGLSILGGDIVWIHGGFPCGDCLILRFSNMHSSTGLILMNVWKQIRDIEVKHPDMLSNLACCLILTLLR